VRRLIFGFLGAALILPIVIVVLGGIARLLFAMGDESGAIIVDRVALAAAVVWLVDLVLLLIVQSLTSVIADPSRRD
jgi:hypothetical protein